MPTVPESAVQAAAEALQAIIDPAGIREMDVYRAHARKVLEAAAPVLAEAVAAKITGHMDAHEPKGSLIGGKSAEDQRRRTWRRHFRIAAQVASLAFSTEEDIKREAAKALAEGRYLACDLRKDDENG